MFSWAELVTQISLSGATIFIFCAAIFIQDRVRCGKCILKNKQTSCKIPNFSKQG